MSPRPPRPVDAVLPAVRPYVDRSPLSTQKSLTPAQRRVLFGVSLGGLLLLATGCLYVFVAGHLPLDAAGLQRYGPLYALGIATTALALGVLAWRYRQQTSRTLRHAHLELKKARADLQKANAHTTHVLESFPECLVCMDADWRLTDLNPRAERYLNLTRDDVIGKDLRTLFSGALGEALCEPLRAAAREQKPAAFETFFEPLDRWFAVYIYPFAEGLSICFDDVTDRKVYEHALIEAREEAARLAQSKCARMSTLSHEIRTPLTSVIGFASILTQETTGEHRDFAHLIERNGNQLMDTLDTFLMDEARRDRDAGAG